MKCRFLVFILVLFQLHVFAQGTQKDYFNSEFLRYRNHIYKSNIKTVILARLDDDLSSPVIELNKGEQLQLSFDDLEADVKEYRYTFVHCDAAWQPSDLITSQFLNGFQDDKIFNYQFSYNTFQRFTHYSLAFPTQDMQPTISGNYLLKVYEGNDADNLIITRRFMVVEPIVDVSAYIHRSSVVLDRDSRQEVDFKVLTQNYRIDNIFDNFHVVVTQNDRWDNALVNLKPLFIKDTELDYNYDDVNNFNGGNEFRYFDIRTIKYRTEKVAEITYDSINRIALYPDKDLSGLPYSIQPDINGKFLITYRDANINSNLESDYVKVNFKLPYDISLTTGNVYIYGQLTDWEVSNESKMKYDVEERAYKGNLYLKQGYYNYQYVFAKDSQASLDESMTEGNHFETENKYTIYVYNRPLGSRYDHLIAVRSFNSKSNY